MKNALIVRFQKHSTLAVTDLSQTSEVNSMKKVSANLTRVAIAIYEKGQYFTVPKIIQT